MSADNETSGAPEIKPPDLRLRPERPRVTHLSRRVLVILGSVSVLAIAGALFYALQTRKGSDGSKELYATGNRQTADGLAGLPRDYTGIPRQAPPLGPPLPSDLGRAILNAETKDLAPQGLNSEEQRPATGKRSRAREPSLHANEPSGEQSGPSAQRRGRHRVSQSGPNTGARFRLCPKHAGSQARLHQWSFG